MIFPENNNDFKNIDLPTIEKISIELPAISKYFEAARLADAFRETSSDTLPVIDNEANIIGIVSEYDLAKILPEWSMDEKSYEHNVRVEEIMSTNVWTEKLHTNIKDLLAKVHHMHTRVIPIVDQNSKYTGMCITRNAVISFLTRKIRPLTLGGLATPLGVYITDGRHQAGVGNFALFLTGFVLSFFILLAQFLTSFIFNGVQAFVAFELLAQISIFVLILRFTPFSKMHAAEHQTINAIEKGHPLSIETIRMQKREHKRCGTNLMVLIVGIQIILLLAVEVGEISSLYKFFVLAFGFIFIFSNWHKFGMIVQKYLTTSVASDFYLKSGMKAGMEILKKHKNDKKTKPPAFTEKIWNMGLAQILSGFFVAMWFVDFIKNVMW